MSTPPAPSRRGRALAIARVAMLAACAASAAPALAQGAGRPTCGIPEFPAPTLCARAGLDTLRATYIVLLDESGSMTPLWTHVKGAVATFVRAVPPGDVLDVRLFSGGVRRLNAPAPASPRLVGDWERQLAGLPAPAGRHTDLGAALEQALDAVAAAPADRQHFVYILTDGAQDPDASSPYAASGGPAWEALRRRAAALAGSRPLAFAIVRLTAQADEQRLLAGALPRADVVPAMGSEQLRRWFETEARSIALRKLQLRIRAERQSPALLDSSQAALRLGDVADSRRVQLRRTLDAVVVDSASIVLAGGARVTVLPSATPSTGVGRLGSAPPTRPWWQPPARLAGALDTAVAVRVRLEPARELGLIGVEAGPLTDSIRVHVPLTGAGVGRMVAWWGTALAVVAALGLAARRGAWATHRPRLTGRLRIEREGEAAESVDLAGLAVATLPLRTRGGRTLATLEARNERGRTALWVVPDGEPVSVGGRPLRTAERVRGPLWLEHRDTTVHYFPS